MPEQDERSIEGDCDWGRSKNDRFFGRGKMTSHKIGPHEEHFEDNREEDGNAKNQSRVVGGQFHTRHPFIGRVDIVTLIQKRSDVKNSDFEVSLFLL